MTVLQKLSVNKFELIENTLQFNEGFIKNYNEEIEKGYFLKVDIQYPEKLHKLLNDLLFLRPKNENWKVEKLVITLHDKTEYFIHIRNLKQALNHGLVLKKVHRGFIVHRVQLKCLAEAIHSYEY